VNEPAVVLTDWLLTLECGLFAALTRGRFAGFFAALALASLLGGAVHGFFHGALWWHVAIWRGALLATGAAALFAAEEALLLLGARRFRGLVRAVFAAYAAALAIGLDRFGLVVAVYLPAAALLLAGFARTARLRGEPRVALGAWGLGATLVAAPVQQLRLGVHPAYFDHNAVYHVIQAAALLLVFAGARALRATDPAAREVRC